MAFKDQLLRCGACGAEFVYTVREQRRRAEQGLPLDPPAFCMDCRGADIRLAGGHDETDLEWDAQAGSAPSPVGGAWVEPAPTEARPTHAESRPRGRRAGRDGGRHGRSDREHPDRRTKVGPRRGTPRGGNGARRPHRQTEVRIRHMGTVKWFDSHKGYGFIAHENGEEVFVHTTGIIAGDSRQLQEGQPVEYEVEYTPRGMQAVDVVPLA